METKESQYTRVLQKYIPSEFIEMVVSLLIKHPVVFKIVKPRKTKLGDFRYGIGKEKHQITVNGNLNPYSFLITTLHEFAHLITFENYGRRIAPHGMEWKKEYSKLILPLIESKHLPHDIEKALLNSLINVKASSCSDIHLNRTLLTYTEHNDNLVTLESLEKNSTFALSGKTFTKGALRRTRYLCSENRTNKLYLVNALARVKEVKNEE